MTDADKDRCAWRHVATCYATNRCGKLYISIDDRCAHSFYFTAHKPCVFLHAQNPCVTAQDSRVCLHAQNSRTLACIQHVVCTSTHEFMCTASTCALCADCFVRHVTFAHALPCVHVYASTHVYAYVFHAHTCSFTPLILYTFTHIPIYIYTHRCRIILS